MQLLEPTIQNGSLPIIDPPTHSRKRPTHRLSTGRAGSPWPEGRPGPALKSPGPGPDSKRLALQMRAEGQLGFKGQGQVGPGPDLDLQLIISTPLNRYFFLKFLHYCSVFFALSHTVTVTVTKFTPTIAITTTMTARTDKGKDR